MNCKVSFDELMALLDGEVPEERAVVLHRHIGSCPDCSRILESQRRLETAWRESFTYPEPELFREMEEKTAWRMGSQRSRVSRWSVIIPAAAAVVAVLLGVRLILLDGPPLPSVLPSGAGETSELETGDSEETPLDAADGQAAFAEMTSGETPPGESELIQRPVEGAPTVSDQSGSFGDDLVQSAGGLGLVNTETVSGIGMAQDDLMYGSGNADTGTGQSSEEGLECIDGIIGMGGGGGMASGTTMLSSGLGGAADIPDESLTPAEPGYDFFADGDSERSCEMQVRSLDQESITEESTLMESLLFRVEQEEADISAGDELSSPATAGLLAGAEQALLPVSVCTSITEEGGASANCSRSASLTWVFDSLGMPDPATALLLDSLFPDWSLYIPFAFRDTVLIATPGEVRLRLTGESHPAKAE